MLQQPVDQSPPPQPSSAPSTPPRPRLPVRSVILLVVALGMIAAAGFLVTRDTPDGTPAAPAGGTEPPAAGGQDNGAFSTTVQDERLSLELVVVPAQPRGPNQVHVTGLVPDGNLADIQNLVVTLHPPDGSPPVSPRMERIGSNHLLATAVPMSISGEWQMELRMRVRETNVDKTRTVDPFREVNVETPLPIG